MSENIWWLRVSAEAMPEIMARLNTLIESDAPTTQTYTEAIPAWNQSTSDLILKIDARAESVLTPEEWASRLATMPAEFICPNPLP